MKGCPFCFEFTWQYDLPNRTLLRQAQDTARRFWRGSDASAPQVR